MAVVTMICRKLCSGKSTYSKAMRKNRNAVILSVDDVMLELFNQDAADMHDVYTERIKNFLLNKSLDIIECGIDVILDWGFWTEMDRTKTKSFYSSRNIDCELHYIDISDDEWHRRIKKRNDDVSAGTVNAYYVDAGLVQKFNSAFEKPEKQEIDFFV